MKHQRFQVRSVLVIAIILGIAIGLTSCTSRQGCPGLITKGQIQNAGRS